MMVTRNSRWHPETTITLALGTTESSTLKLVTVLYISNHSFPGLETRGRRFQGKMDTRRHRHVLLTSSTFIEL